MTSATSADDALTQYFEGLRDRQLFFVAESYGLGRLAETNVLTSERIAVAVELSKTYCDHATMVSDAERVEYWQRAEQVVNDLRGTLSQHPRAIELHMQAALVPASRAKFLTKQLALYPENRQLRTQVESVTQTAIDELQTVAENLNAMEPRPGVVDSLDLWELKSLRQAVWLALGTAWQNHADATGDSQSLTQAAKWLETAAREKADAEWTARARIAWAANLRRQKQWNHAERLLQTVAESQPSIEIADSALVERVRLLLAEGKSPDAAELLQKRRQHVSRVSGELAYWHVVTLAALRQVTVEKNQPAETQKLTQLIRDAVQRTDVLIGGYWSARSQQVWSQIEAETRYGPEIAKRIRQAETAEAQNNGPIALQRYENAIEMAERSNRRDVVFELNDTRASLLIRQQRFADAADALATTVAEFPDRPRTAELDLLHAICLGKLYQQTPTAESREAYSQALQSHLEDFSQSATSAEARWMLGSLQEARLQHTDALQYFRAIPLDHPRGPIARVAAARCYLKIVRWLDSLGRQTDDPSRQQSIAEKRSEWERHAIQELSQWITPFPETPTAKNSWQAETAVWLARLQLERIPPRYAAADEALAQVFQVGEVFQDGEEASTVSERWQVVMTSAAVDRVLALAGEHRFSDAKAAAERLHRSSLARRLELLRRLQSLEDDTPDALKKAWGELLLIVAAPLDTDRDTFNPTDQQTIDLAMAQAYSAVGQSTRAGKIYRRLIENGTVDAEILASAAENLNQETDPKALARAQAYWQRAEKTSPPGSDAWFAARFHNLDLMLRRGNIADFRKLLGVTKILHPDFGGPNWQAKFEQLEREALEKSR